MLRTILRSIFGGAAPQKATRDTTTIPQTPAANPKTVAADEQKAMVDAILELRRIVETRNADDIVAAVDAFNTNTVGRLVEHERAAEVANAQTMFTALSCEKSLQRGDPLTPVATMSDGEPSYFRGKNVSIEGPRKDDYGQLDLCEKGIFYEGEKRLSIPWNKVLTVGLSDRSLIVHRSSGGEPYDFGLRTVGEARLAHLVALAVLKQQSNTTGSTASRQKPQSQPRTYGPAQTGAEEPAPIGTTIELPGQGGAFAVQVVGESHRQSPLKALGGERRLRGEYVAFTAVLVPDPKNAYDPNAIAVYISGGSRIGYLSREDALEYREVSKILRARQAVGLCRAKLIGGTPDKPSIGVALDLADPASTLTALIGNDQPF